jgi:hypothetical protein
VGRDWDAGREGRIGDGLLPGGGQREFTGPQAQRGVRAVAVVGRASPMLEPQVIVLAVEQAAGQRRE